MEKQLTKDLKIGLTNFKILTENEPEGTFEAYVSKFNNIDYADEVVMPGAFMESLQRKLPKICWSHNWEEIIGTVVSAVEDQFGLKIKGRLVLTVQRAKEAWELMKAGACDEFSIGYNVDKWSMEERDGKQVRLLEKLSLFEISPVLAGCNPDTELLDIKSKEEKEEEVKNKELKEIVEDEKSIKMLFDDNTEMVINKNQIFDNYLAEKSGVKVANDKEKTVKKIILIKQKMKESKKLDDWLYKQFKDLHI